MHIPVSPLPRTGRRALWAIGTFLAGLFGALFGAIEEGFAQGSRRIENERPSSTKPKPQRSTPSGGSRREGNREQETWITLERYDRAVCRQAFSACDRDGDDRLDIREAIRSLTNMGDLQDPTGFRTVDENRDGFVNWPEFDKRYRRIVQRGDKFLFRPARPFVDPSAAVKPSAEERETQAVRFMMQMVSDDDDPHVSRAEFEKLLTSLKQPADAEKLFPVLDRDGSGGLSDIELRSIVGRVPYLGRLARAEPETIVDRAVTKKVLHARLLRIHPSLARFSTEIFQAADENGDGRLQDEELKLSK